MVETTEWTTVFVDDVQALINEIVRDRVLATQNLSNVSRQSYHCHYQLILIADRFDVGLMH